MTRRVALALVIGLLGCGGLGSREDDLNKTLLQFVEAVRWSKWQVAASHVDPEKRQKWLAERIAGSRNLNMADVTLQGITRKDVRAEDATVFVQMTWFRYPDTTLRSSLWKQSWKHGRHGWKMVEEVPMEAPAAPIEPDPPVNWP